MAYADKLPRKNQQEHICQHLDKDGNRCRNTARYETSVHEHDEHFGGWYAVELCAKHMKEREGTDGEIVT